MVITYQLPDTATLAWVPCPRQPRHTPPDLFLVTGGVDELCQILGNGPQPGHVIECPSGSFRVVRTVRACKACDLSPHEMDCLGLGTKSYLGAFGQQAIVKATIGDAWQHWGWLVEVKAESKTRSDLRGLCEKLGIPLKEEKST